MLIKEKDQYRWRKAFAWYLVPINQQGDKVWLQIIERRRPKGWGPTWTAFAWDTRLPGATEYAPCRGYDLGLILPPFV